MTRDTPRFFFTPRPAALQACDFKRRVWSKRCHVCFDLLPSVPVLAG